jgi:DNA-binding MarR family transcriptional regulator
VSGLSQQDYTELLAFRTALRRFEGWSEQQARRVGLSPAQHQLLLAVKGHPDSRGPTIGEVAEYLNVRHHSAVGLADRAEGAGIVVRTRLPEDARTVRLTLTELGDEKIRQLSELHIAELRHLTPLLDHLTAVKRDANSEDDEISALP